MTLRCEKMICKCKKNVNYCKKILKNSINITNKRRENVKIIEK